MRVLLAALGLTLLGACGLPDGGPGPVPTEPTMTTVHGTTPSTTPAPIVTTTTSTLPCDVVTYTVRPGDTLWSIALRFGTTVEAIVERNGLEDRDVIEVGQVLLIPAGSAPSTTTTTVPGTSTTVPRTTTTTKPPAGAAQVVRRLPTTQPVVLLTFDAGSDAGHTASILDTLRRYDVEAAFGLTGKWVEQNPELAIRIVEEGHEAINHSYDHPSFTGYSTGTEPLIEAERRRQVERAEEVVAGLTGFSTKPWFRPPYGDYDEALTVQLGTWGYLYMMMWTVDSLGWKGLSANEITDRCLDRVEPGAIFLFHVGSASEDGAALPEIVEGLRARGYEPVGISEYLGG